MYLSIFLYSVLKCGGSTQTQIVDKLDYKYIVELRCIFLSSIIQSYDSIPYILSCDWTNYDFSEPTRIFPKPAIWDKSGPDFS